MLFWMGWEVVSEGHSEKTLKQRPEQRGMSPIVLCRKITQVGENLNCKGPGWKRDWAVHGTVIEASVAGVRSASRKVVGNLFRKQTDQMLFVGQPP